MAMIRFAAFTPKDHETVKAYEAAEAKDPDHIDPDLAEAYRTLVKDNFGKLMSTMIGEIARFFDIAIKRKYDWHGYYGWLFSFHGEMTCWYGISYKADSFLSCAFALKNDDAGAEGVGTLVEDEGYEVLAFGRDGSEWAVKKFELDDIYSITDDDEQMSAISRIAEDQLDILEG